MRKPIFLSSNETFQEAIKQSLPHFKTLLTTLPQDCMLNQKLQAFCNETYIIAHQLQIPTVQYEDSKKFLQTINANIQNLFFFYESNPEFGKNNHVQCFGQEFKDYSIQFKSLNFGKTILETSLLSELTELSGTKWLNNLLNKYIIIMKYKNDYFQVFGPLLPELTCFKYFDKKKRETNYTNVYTYSTEYIDRFSMLYCSHMNRHSGLFKKSKIRINLDIFFEKGMSKQNNWRQIKQMSQVIVNNIVKPEVYRNSEREDLVKMIEEWVIKTRSIFQISKGINKNGQQTEFCQFDKVLTKFCRLPKNYLQMKKRLTTYLKTGAGSSQQMFQDLYKESTDYLSVYRMLKNIIKNTVPVKLFGCENMDVFCNMLKQFISMKRYENYRIYDFLQRMNMYTIPWMTDNCYSKNVKAKKFFINRRRKIVAAIIALIYNKLIVPLLKHTFYITQKHKQANKLFYYRKPIWLLISKLSLKKFSESNIEILTEGRYASILQSGLDYPEGKLRIMPKKGTFRPIITFNKKRKIQGDFSGNKATLNQILSDTQLVLRKLKNILGTQFGNSIFDNKQIARHYQEFVKKWNAKGRPKLVYFTLDIKKCYDSIDTNTLVKIIQQTAFFQPAYMLVKYFRVYRNKKPIQDQRPLRHYFNLKQRVHAVSIFEDPIKVSEDSTPAINIFSARQKTLYRQEIIKRLKQLCDGSIIRYKKQIWLQKLGIPQGLNVSGVLCSLYFAYLQKIYIKVKQGLLMRLTDDYMYIGPEEQAVNILTDLLECARKHNFVFNNEKINKNFMHPLITQMTQQKQFIWIGKRINIETLQMFPATQKDEMKLFYAMNVNINYKQAQGFLKNKLKSLLTNHFSAYFKPNLFPLQTCKQNIRLYCEISLAKFFPFLISLHKIKFYNIAQTISKIFQSTIHQFLIYAVSLHRNQDNKQYYYLQYTITALQSFLHFMKNKRSYQFLLRVQREFRTKLKNFKLELRKYDKCIESNE